MDAAVTAERQETDGIAWQSQKDLPGFSISARGWCDRTDQSDPTRLGAILCHRPFESVFLIHPKLGRTEDSAPSGQSVQASRLRLEAMEQGRVVRRARSLFGVPSLLSTYHFG